MPPGFANLYRPQITLGECSFFFFIIGPLPLSLLLPQDFVYLHPETMETFLDLREELIHHGEWMVSFSNPTLPGTQGD